MNIPTLLDPSNCTLLLVDYQPQMIFGVKSIDGQTLVNNVEGLAKAAKAFGVPTVLSSIAEKSFSGPTVSQLRNVFPEKPIIDRTSMNAWDDARVVDAVAKIGRKKLVLAGLWTEVCVTMPALDAMRAGYEVYVVADACGGTSEKAHEHAISRMEKNGAQTITWLQFLLELQRDWAHQETYYATMGIVKQHAGAYGVGVQYAEVVLGGAANEGKRSST